MSTRESLELLQAALAMAVVDGKISGHERALLKALAGKAGVGDASLNAMIDLAKKEPAKHDELFATAIKEPEKAMQLLVASANLDGHISEEERNMLVDISIALGISANRFGEIFQAGMASAKRVVRSKGLKDDKPAR